eukprot:4348123-Pyramimonas_sp.AAC.1
MRGWYMTEAVRWNVFWSEFLRNLSESVALTNRAPRACAGSQIRRGIHAAGAVRMRRLREG